MMDHVIMQVDEAVVGLTTPEVAERVANGAVNRSVDRRSRSAVDILRANVLTRFNAIIGALCVLVLIFGAPIDALFGLVIVVNTAVGVTQEFRAKRILERLDVAGRAPVRVRRDGAEVALVPEDLVVDDIVLVASGDRIPVDGEVVASAGLEVDESLLTGEADAVDKEPRDEVLSGTFVVAGSGAFRAVKVGADAYAARLAAEASRFSLARSELYQGINHLLRLLTWVIIPVGALLVVRQFTGGESVPAAVVSSVAGVVPMIPEGLVLLTSAAFAVGVIRLARRRCLVQELPAVEVLARVDTLCLDKTGTLTEPGLTVREIRYATESAASDRPRSEAVLAAMARSEDRPNPTLRAIADAIHPAHEPPTPTDVEPFSSARKYAAATFADGGELRGRWLLGAADVVLAKDQPERGTADELAAQGLRVLALVNDGEFRVLIVLEQRLREQARPALHFFAEQGVTVKVISGDNAASVGAIAGSLDVPGARSPVDARDLPTEFGPLATQLDDHSVFGRVTPQQKRDFVRALRSRGHVVAMTGDGVNDALALKEADLGLAMGSGSGATRAVAKIVLLDDDFTVLPAVVSEGRRVLANIERVAKLFLTKTVYSVLLAVLVGIAHFPFPFLPRHVTLVASLTIGIPGAVLALAPTTERARPGFLPRVLRFSVPAGLACAIATFAAYAWARSVPSSDLVVDRSTATLTLFLVAYWALILIARPFTTGRLVTVVAMGAAFAGAALLPGVSSLFLLQYGNMTNDLVALGCAVVGVFLLSVGVRLLDRNPSTKESGGADSVERPHVTEGRMT